MTREEAFGRVEWLVATGAPIYPRQLEGLKAALGSLSAEEESILASHRRARVARELAHAEGMAIMQSAAQRLLRDPIDIGDPS